MSFPFKTPLSPGPTIRGMKPQTCPFHDSAASAKAAPAIHPPGSWPPGPRSGITGWGLLRSMSRDLLGSLEAWRAEYGGLVHLRIWPEHQILVTDAQLVRELLVEQHDALTRWERGIAVMAQLHGNSVLIAEGEPWRKKRSALQSAFAPKAVQAHAPVITAAAASALAKWPTAAHWPIEQAFTALGMDIILRIMFSSEIDADAREAERAVHAVSIVANEEMYWPVSLPDWLPWKRAKREALGVLNRLIDRHLQARLAMRPAVWPQDVLSRLLALHLADTAAWPLRAVRDECMTAFLAGHETSAATLTWWAWCMAANPDAQQAARQELDKVLQGRAPTAQDLPQLRYLAQSLKETMRLYPAAPVLLTRRATRPITLGGWQLPAGTMFTLPVGILQREAQHFDEPATFRPDRFGADAPDIARGAYMPFGAGPRVCLGQHLAMTEMTLIAAMFLQRYRVEVPAGMAPPTPQFNITLRPAQPLHLQLSPA